MSHTRRILVAALASLIFHSTEAIAFDGGEHERLSSAAFQLVLYTTEEGLKSEPKFNALKALLPVPSNTQCSSWLSYGYLSYLADHIRDVSELLRNDQTAMSLPQSIMDLDCERLRDIRRDVFGWLDAAHINEAHFQGGALGTYWTSHDRAMTAAVEGNLFAAMVLEAYADHFLQDFYAPGHLVTPRTEMVDFASAASHDKYNRNGLIFSFDQTYATKL